MQQSSGSTGSQTSASALFGWCLAATCWLTAFAAGKVICGGLLGRLGRSRTLDRRAGQWA